ncbi:hypothetical protein KUCAC02_016412 [Chaenocephalus aceratus]|nr:hypothetical protein KUCAC02_016412 [Chaenocephalus aceratus]
MTASGSSSSMAFFGRRVKRGDGMLVEISKNNSNMAARILTDFQVLTRTIFGILRTYHHQQKNHPGLNEDPPTSLTTEDYNLPPTSPTNLATRHEHHGDKKKNWSLTPSREVLIIGSSNISRIPPINNEKIQVDSYPGANLIQAAHLIKYTTPTSEDTKEVLLCFGVNDRNTENIAILDNNLTQLLSSAKKTFPNIHIPSINFSPGLPLITTIRNTLIERTPGHISQLDMKDFSTERDQVHWTQETAKKMWDHWRSSLPL